MKPTLIFAFFLSIFSLSAQSSKKEFKQLLKTFPGKYKTVEKTIDAMTITVSPIENSILGKNVFYIKYIKVNGSLYRQRLILMKFDGQKITSEAQSFVKDSSFIDLNLDKNKIKNLSQKDLKSSLGCADTWSKVGDEFIAKMDSCAFKSERRGGKNIFIYSRMMVSETGMGTTEAGKDETGKILFGSLEGYALKLKRVKEF